MHKMSTREHGAGFVVLLTGNHCLTGRTQVGSNFRVSIGSKRCTDHFWHRCGPFTVLCSREEACNTRAGISIGSLSKQFLKLKLKNTSEKGSSRFYVNQINKWDTSVLSLKFGMRCQIMFFVTPKIVCVLNRLTRCGQRLLLATITQTVWLLLTVVKRCFEVF